MREPTRDRRDLHHVLALFRYGVAALGTRRGGVRHGKIWLVMSPLGHELPRHLAERAAVMPPKAAAPSRDQGGRGGPIGEIPDVYSITSSARPMSGSGKVMPSVLAVLRLTTISIFTTCCTGRSAGRMPLRIFPA